MKVSHKSLWKLLIDKDISPMELHRKSGMSSVSMTKLRRRNAVSLVVAFER